MPLDGRDRQHLAVAAFVLTLIVVGLWLLTAMRRNAELEACLMARRQNCEAKR